MRRPRIMKPLRNLVDERTFTVVPERRATQNDSLPSDSPGRWVVPLLHRQRPAFGVPLTAG